MQSHGVKSLYAFDFDVINLVLSAVTIYGSFIPWLT